MALARRERTVAAAPETLWAILCDPHHMPRWWPGVSRMEGVHADRFTQVFVTRRGRPVRADFKVVRAEPLRRITWEQEVAGTPFERVLGESVTEIELEATEGGTRVVISQSQRPQGYYRTGGFLVRRASARKLDEALEGLERICAT